VNFPSDVGELNHDLKEAIFSYLFIFFAFYNSHSVQSSVKGLRWAKFFIRESGQKSDRCMNDHEMRRANEH
jgi:hypothetical protein